MIEENVKVEKEEPKKSHTGIYVFIMLIAGICMGIGGSYYYFNYMTKDSNNCVASTKNTMLGDRKLDVDSILVKDLVSRYDFYVNGTDEIYNNLYKEDIPSVSDIDSKLRISMAYQNMNIGLFNPFTSDVLKDSYVKIFGPKVQIDDGDFTYGCGTFSYDSAEKLYTYKPAAGCGGTTASTLLRKIIEAKVKDGNIYINAAVGIKKASDKNPGESEILNRDGVIDDIDETSFDIDKDYKKLDKVQYKFAYDKENNNYYLISIKRYGL